MSSITMHAIHENLCIPVRYSAVEKEINGHGTLKCIKTKSICNTQILHLPIMQAITTMTI